MRTPIYLRKKNETKTNNNNSRERSRKESVHSDKHIAGYARGWVTAITALLTLGEEGWASSHARAACIRERSTREAQDCYLRAGCGCEEVIAGARERATAAVILLWPRGEREREQEERVSWASGSRPASAIINALWKLMAFRELSARLVLYIYARGSTVHDVFSIYIYSLRFPFPRL